MALEVIGAGFSRTGTTSLQLALEQLGCRPCYHAAEVAADERTWLDALDGARVDWVRLFAGYRAALDWPVFVYFEELAETFPDALVLLTVRDPHSWYRSFHQTVYSTLVAGRDWQNEAVQEWSHRRYEHNVERPFDGRFSDADYAIKVFREHNERVRRVIAPDRLLVYDLSDGWAPLCRALGVPIPEEPFPHVNTSREFQEAILAGKTDNLRRARHD
jgi:hypothetical protein